jgi:hypothetical protein
VGADKTNVGFSIMWLRVSWNIKLEVGKCLKMIRGEAVLGHKKKDGGRQVDFSRMW